MSDEGGCLIQNKSSLPVWLARAAKRNNSKSLSARLVQPAASP